MHRLQLKSGPSSAVERTFCSRRAGLPLPRSAPFCSRRAGLPLPRSAPSAVKELAFLCRGAHRLQSKNGPSSAEERTFCSRRAGLPLPRSAPSALEERAFLCRGAHLLQSKSGPSSAEERTVCTRRAGLPLPRSAPSAVEERAVRFAPHAFRRRRAGVHLHLSISVAPPGRVLDHCFSTSLLLYFSTSLLLFRFPFPSNFSGEYTTHTCPALDIRTPTLGYTTLLCPLNFTSLLHLSTSPLYFTVICSPRFSHVFHVSFYIPCF